MNEYIVIYNTPDGNEHQIGAEYTVYMTDAVTHAVVHEHASNVKVLVNCPECGEWQPVDVEWECSRCHVIAPYPRQTTE